MTANKLNELAKEYQALSEKLKLEEASKRARWLG